MMFTTHRRPTIAAAALSCVALAIAGCSSKSASPTASAGAPSTSASDTAVATSGGAADCAAFKDYMGHSGTTVTAYSTIVDVEADNLNKSWANFQKCTGITIKYEGSQEFETQIDVRVKGGKAPDMAFFPQPALMAKYKDQLKPAPQSVIDMAKLGWGEAALSNASIGGKLYSTPLDSNVKSFVWYSPSWFKTNNYAVPTTWDEMLALSDKIIADHKDMKPWCAGIESGQATGWSATDWLEDVMLRTQSPQTYDDWVNHKIPFNDPKVAAALDKVAGILKNPKYVNGAFGGVDSIATTSFKEGGLGVAATPPTCAMHRQASFYASNFDKKTKIAPDGDVFAFYLPPIDPQYGKPVLTAGTFAAAFTDRPEVQAFQTYLASKEWAISRVSLGGFVSGNKGVPLATFTTDVDKLSATILQDPKAVTRFDASDIMPPKVGAGTEWKGLTDWITGKSTKDTLDAIEASWPK